ncbi:MAG TPA: cytochrome c oxidase subunit II [Gammaproteobacteria bacterium]
MLLGGCAGVQSTFSTFGTEAEALRALGGGMFAAAALITLGVLALAWHAVRTDEGLDFHGGLRIVLWLGAIVPTLLLTALLVVSLPRMEPLSAAEDGVEIAVDGEQFWWRVSYRSGAGAGVETANEIRIPAGRAVTFELESPDVIHSFWIPGLAGKLDMIPGRTNVLTVLATRVGSFRGACAEFCGLSHANMAFDVIALEPDDFDRWLARLARPAAAVTGDGRRLFDEYGCPACHVVRGHHPGTPIGPDLTHFGSRVSFAAGTLPLEIGAVSAFLRDPAARKPGVRMPSFVDMPERDANAIAAYLLELR